MTAAYSLARPVGTIGASTKPPPFLRHDRVTVAMPRLSVMRALTGKPVSVLVVSVSAVWVMTGGVVSLRKVKLSADWPLTLALVVNWARTR